MALNTVQYTGTYNALWPILRPIICWYVVKKYFTHCSEILTTSLSFFPYAFFQFILQFPALVAWSGRFWLVCLFAPSKYCYLLAVKKLPTSPCVYSSDSPPFFLSASYARTSNKSAVPLAVIGYQSVQELRGLLNGELVSAWHCFAGIRGEWWFVFLDIVSGHAFQWLICPASPLTSWSPLVDEGEIVFICSNFRDSKN